MVLEAQETTSEQACFYVSYKKTISKTHVLLLFTVSANPKFEMVHYQVQVHVQVHSLNY